MSTASTDVTTETRRPARGTRTVAPAAAESRKTLGSRLRKQWVNVVSVLVAAFWVFPVYWMVTTALKQGDNILSFVPKWFPTNATLSSFVTAITKDWFWTSVRNSVVVVGIAVVCATALAFLGAVAVARFRFLGRKAFLFAVIAVQMVPLTAMVIPWYLMLNTFGLANSLTGIIAVYMAVTMPFTLWVLRGFIINIPEELEQAAMVDGCTRLGAFRRILFPLVAPGLVATSIFAIITAWNEFVLAYVVLDDPSKQTLTVWLDGFITQKGIEWGPLMAAATLSAIPVVVFFMLVHKHVVSGMTAGAVKG